MAIAGDVDDFFCFRCTALCCPRSKRRCRLGVRAGWPCAGSSMRPASTPPDGGAAPAPCLLGKPEELCTRCTSTPCRTKASAPASLSAIVKRTSSRRSRLLRRRVEAAPIDDGAACDADLSTIAKFSQNLSHSHSTAQRHPAHDLGTWFMIMHRT